MHREYKGTTGHGLQASAQDHGDLDPGQAKIEEVWTTIRLKVYVNNLVKEKKN